MKNVEKNLKNEMKLSLGATYVFRNLKYIHTTKNILRKNFYIIHIQERTREGYMCFAV